MPSVWLEKRGDRHRVRYRIGGGESAPKYGGSFGTKREALIRKAWVLGELAVMRIPNTKLLEETRNRSLDVMSTRSRRRTSPLSSVRSRRPGRAARRSEDRHRAVDGLRLRGRHAEPGPGARPGEAAAGGQSGDHPADSRTCACGASAARDGVQAASPGARRDRDVCRRAGAAHMGWRRRAARPLARLAGLCEDQARTVGECAAARVRCCAGALSA